jgi:hypothetical protein
MAQQTMFTPADLSRLIATSTRLGVSLFLPTHVKGREILQEPIRLKNLVAEARNRLVVAGLTQAESGSFLAPATALVDDHDFWQHQEQGLALFLSGGDLQIHRTPFPLPVRVVVGPGFHVRPLLTGWVADGPFWVLTITADRARLLRASRFSLDEQDDAGLPGPEDGLSEPDYENPVQASPVARPHTGLADISHAQVYGASPPEWRRGRLVRYVHRVAATVDRRLRPSPAPLVLAADAEISGHFRKFSTRSSRLAGVIETNAGSVDDARLHRAAYAIAQPYLDAARQEALDLFATLHGNGDSRAVTGVPDVIRAAHHGRVDTLLLTETGPVWGRYDATEDQTFIGTAHTSGQDLLDVASVLTLRHGGNVHVLRADIAPAAAVAAILRY